METIGGDLRQMQRTPARPITRRSVARSRQDCDLSRGHISCPTRRAAADATAHRCSIAPTEPAVIFGQNVVVTDPTPDKIARLLGLNLEFSNDEMFDVLI